MRQQIKTWNVIDRSTGKCVYQSVGAEPPAVLDGHVVREAVLRPKHPGDYSDRSYQRAEAGFGE